MSAEQDKATAKKRRGAPAYQTKAVAYLNPSKHASRHVRDIARIAKDAQTAIMTVREDAWTQHAKEIPIELCQGNVMRPYIRGALDTRSTSPIDMIFLLQRTGTREQLRRAAKRDCRWRTHAFALCKLIQSEATWGVYVDVVCAKRCGRLLFKALEDVACQAGASFIRLSALENVINYYRRLHYHHARECHASRDDAIETAAKKVEALKINKTIQPVYYAFLRTLTRLGYASRCHIPANAAAGAPECPARSATFVLTFASQKDATARPTVDATALRPGVAIAHSFVSDFLCCRWRVVC